MRFIPDYRVCYKGDFYEADEEMEIDPMDANEMSQHGEVLDDFTPNIPSAKEETSADEDVNEASDEADEAPKKKRGRPPKESNDETD